MEKKIKYGLAGIGILLLLALIVSSTMNKSSYYIKEVDGGIQVWQGRFAPMGAKLYMELPDMKMPENAQSSYFKDEIYMLIFSFCQKKADSMIEQDGILDFAKIYEYLNNAKKYALTKADKKTVQSRIDAIDFTVLQYRADTLIGNNTPEDLEKAEGYLEKARSLKINGFQKEMLDQKIAHLKERLDKIETEKTENKPAVETDTAH